MSTVTWSLRIICAGLLLLHLPAEVQAQYTYATNNDTITITGYTGFDAVLTIPSTINGLPVISIGAEAFYSHWSLINITIPNSVTSIGSDAFNDCTSLTSVTIPNTVTSLGDGVFYDCTSLSSITIPNGVTSIGSEVFYGCSSLSSVMIGTNVTSIGDNAFYSCISLTSITIPNTVTNIGAQALYSCTSLTNVAIPNGVTSLGDEVFYGCTNLISVTIGTNVTGIGTAAFYDCTSLTSVTIPASVTSIGGEAFYSCTKLTRVAIPDGVTEIEPQVFYGCSSLTSVALGTNVTSVDDLAFYSCTSLTSVTIPDSVTSIGYGAFWGCSSLTSANIPNGVTNIGDDAFVYCYDLASITIPNGMTTIGSNVFYSCNSLTSVTIPNSVINIGYEAFGGCGLSCVTIPGSVTSIGGAAFYDCYNLTRVYFLGNAPQDDVLEEAFFDDSYATGCYLPGTTGWGTTFSGIPVFECSGQCTGLAIVLVIVTANPSQGGSVSGSGTYPFGTNVQISASANSGWTFTGWGDGNTQNPRTITVPSYNEMGIMYTADFSQQVATITVQANPGSGGSVSGGGTYPVGTNVQISASANSGWTFTGWGDGNTQNPRTITVPSGGATYTANFSQQTAVITVQANPGSGGTVSGAGTYPVGTNVQISASANSGWTFTSWSDGGAQSHTITVPLGGASYTANFATTTCAYAFSSTTTNVSASSGSGSLNVTADSGCNWTASSDNTTWLHTTSSGSGSGTLIYSYDANSNSNPRAAHITVPGQSFMVTQVAGGELVGYWKFDEGSGTLTTDSSGNGNTGLVQGATWVPGWSGTALYFNGSLSDQVVIADSPSLNPTNAITIAAWIYAEDWNGNRRIIQKGNRSGWIDDQYTLCAQSGLLQFNLQLNPNTAITNVTGESLPSVGAWHHVAATYDGSAMRLYVDGQQSGELEITGQIQTTSDPLGIGNKLGSAYASDDFHGVIDEVRLYARALSLSEIQEIACPYYSIVPTTETSPADGMSGSVAVSASNCSWSANSGVDWITITSGSSGTGDGTVGYSVAVNTNADERTGTVKIGSQTFTLTEAGMSCSYSLTLTNANFSAAGGSCSVGITAPTGCVWTATSGSPSFITINSGSSGSGSGTVSYTVAANLGAARSGTLMIGGQTFTVDQTGATPVTFSLGSVVQTCKTKTKIDKKTETTNTTTTCTVAFDLDVRNTGATENRKSSVLLWLEQGCPFNPNAGPVPLVKKVRALKGDRSVTIKVRKSKLNGDQAGTFIFVTDADTNILASVTVPSSE
jgi:hypothetical protein